MNNNTISNLKIPTLDNDAATKEYVDTSITNLTSTDLNMNSNKITSLAAPTLMVFLH